MSTNHGIHGDNAQAADVSVEGSAHMTLAKNTSSQGYIYMVDLYESCRGVHRTHSLGILVENIFQLKMINMSLVFIHTKYCIGKLLERPKESLWSPCHIYLIIEPIIIRTRL